MSIMGSMNKKNSLAGFYALFPSEGRSDLAARLMTSNPLYVDRGSWAISDIAISLAERPF